MAHSGSNRDGEDESEHREDAEEQTSPALILPPHSQEEERAPYANEMLLLSFEGRHKKFEVDYELESNASSSSPLRTPTQLKKTGWFTKLVNKLFKPIV